MKKILLTMTLLISTQIHSSMLSSALFSTTKTATTVATEVAKEATKQAWSCESLKKSVCTAIANTLEPMTTFAYDNMTLAATTTVAIGYIAYKAGKYVNMPTYKPEDVQQVTVIAQPLRTRAVRTER